MLSVCQLSRSAGVKVPTIRYYEEIGLLDAPERSAGNRRRYPPAAEERLAFIRHARALGFSLEAIRSLIALSRHPEQDCADADRIAAEQLAEVRARIARLRRLETELARIAACESHAVGACGVLQALGDHGLCDGPH